MPLLNVFALVILIVLLIVAVAVWITLAILPGKIARQRAHPQAEAINICGWCGAITLGLLMPLAFIWAYTKLQNNHSAIQPTVTDSEDEQE